MTRTHSIQPEFVKEIPESLEEGILYISLPYQVAAHACCCGCKSRVDTPLLPSLPTRWNLIQNEDLVSLYPSIGNTRLPCLSHYWIRNNVVEWETPFTEYQAARVRLCNQIERESFRKYRSDPPIRFRILAYLRMLLFRLTWRWRR